MSKQKIKLFIENFAIVILLIVVLTLLVIVTVMLINTDRSLVPGILGGIGNVTSGIGALLAAAAALVGVSAWKKQITYGKYLDFIWKAQVACQNVSINWKAYYVASATPRPTSIDAQNAHDLFRKSVPNSRLNTERFLVELTHACQHLDRLVTKSNLDWTMRSNRIKHQFITMANEFDTNSSDANSQQRHYYKEISDSLESLEKDLEELENEYR